MATDIKRAMKRYESQRANDVKALKHLYSLGMEQSYKNVLDGAKPVERPKINYVQREFEFTTGS